MKKLFLPLALVAVLFTSCNDDDSSMVTPEPEPIDQTPTPAQELKLITTSNTSGKISFTDLLATTPTAKSFTISSTDADGVYYDTFKDQVVLASRTNNRVEAYNGLRNAIISSATTLDLSFSSSMAKCNLPFPFIASMAFLTIFSMVQLCKVAFSGIIILFFGAA